jgi:hypothetical protein
LAKEITARYDELAEQLSRADRSAHAQGDDWLATTEPSWNEFLEATTRADESGSRDEFLVHIESARRAIRTMERSLDERVEAETRRHQEL